MAFPVSGYNSRAIQSFFGDPRDGGKRDHHGVDIFASRHSIVIAPLDGSIVSVGESKRGGHTIWMYSAKHRINIYFAHLEKQLVKQYQNVKAGDTIGTVGNTGNARFTPPHLHFGIYAYRDIHDPFYYLCEQNDVIPGIKLDTSHLGKYLYSEQLTNANTLQTIKAVKILAISENKYRVRYPDQTKVFVLAESNAEIREKSSI